MHVRLSDAFYDGLLDVFDLRKCKSVACPNVDVRSLREDQSELLDEVTSAKYRTAVGKLMWASMTRFDIAYLCKELGRRVRDPSKNLLQALLRVLRYLQGTRGLYLCCRIDDMQQLGEIRAYCDANWASDPQRRSTSGGFVTLEGFICGYWSRTQSVVALSSCEAELISAVTAAAEAQLVKSLVEELGLKAELRVLNDNTSAVKLCFKKGIGRLKHIDVRCMWLQDAVRSGDLTIQAIRGVDNPADLLTKPLENKRFRDLARKIGFVFEEDAEYDIAMLENVSGEAEQEEEDHWWFWLLLLAGAVQVGRWTCACGRLAYACWPTRQRERATLASTVELPQGSLPVERRDLGHAESALLRGRRAHETTPRAGT